MDFCPRCGNRGTHGKLCASCAGTDQPTSVKKGIIVRLCVGCHKSAVRNRWTPYKNIADAVARAVQERISGAVEICDAGVAEPLGPGLQRDITIAASIDGVDRTLPAELVTTLCTSCGKRHSQYFEGILQLRNPRPEIVEFIRETIAERASKGVFLSKEEPVRGGVDFHITSQRYLQVLGNTLVKRFGGTIKVNASIFSRSRQTSRDLYRVNVLYTALDFAAGDVVDFGDGPVRITSTAQKVVGVNLRTGKRGPLPQKQTHRVLIAEKTRVVKVSPYVEVLDPQTYQPVRVENAVLPKLTKGEKVRVVTTGGRHYLI